LDLNPFTVILPDTAETLAMISVRFLSNPHKFGCNACPIGLSFCTIATSQLVQKMPLHVYLLHGCRDAGNSSLGRSHAFDCAALYIHSNYCNQPRRIRGLPKFESRVSSLKTRVSNTKKWAYSRVLILETRYSIEHDTRGIQSAQSWFIHSFIKAINVKKLTCLNIIVRTMIVMISLH